MLTSLVTTQANACLWANETYTATSAYTIAHSTNFAVSEAGTVAGTNPQNRACAQYQVVTSTGTYNTATGGSWSGASNPNSGRVVAVAIYDATPTAASAAISDRRTRRRVIYR